MKDFTKNLKDGLAKTSQFVKKSSEEAVTKLKEGAEKLTHLGPTAKEKIIDVVNDVVAVLPLLEQAGYRTNEFKIGIALAPVIEVSFSRFLEVPEGQLEQLKKEHEDKKMFNMILSMLHTANSLSTKLEADDFNFHETVVEITVPPKVSLRYVHKTFEPTNINLLE
ncbi:hypothetical protein [Aureispira anguillae]|uniref:Uncharacterized protein n=1 Tax=Aureispira anguillae TaxID=2864201 RepID=A0A915YE27_9BACT|nr:hypothetical protein [Aureispira anguillae]BDS11417.1 hypothetical protein AsAng_0021310 [Aureispira anguillae]